MAPGRGRGVGPSHLLQGHQAGAGCQARPGVPALPRGAGAFQAAPQLWVISRPGASWPSAARGGCAAGLLRALGVPTPPTTACICLLCLPQRPPSKVKLQSLPGVPTRPLAPKRAEPDSGSAALGVVGRPLCTRPGGRGGGHPPARDVPPAAQAPLRPCLYGSLRARARVCVCVFTWLCAYACWRWACVHVYGVCTCRCGTLLL